MYGLLEWKLETVLCMLWIIMYPVKATVPGIAINLPDVRTKKHVRNGGCVFICIDLIIVNIHTDY